MRISLSSKSGLAAASTILALARETLGRFASRKSLYRRLGSAVIIETLALGFLGVVPSVAQRPQLKRPEEAPQEKPAEAKPKKLVNEPRVVGLLQLNNSGKGTLIPIAIRIDGKFYDASVYKADPVPMALEGGIVYEVEKTGESQGLFTVGGALHNQNPNSPTPWLGAGSYVLNGSVVANNIHKAEDKPRGLDSDDDAPPRLTRGKEAESPTNQSSGTNVGPTTGSQNTGSAPGAAAPSSTNSGSVKSGSAAPAADSQPSSGASGGSSPGSATSATGSSASDDSGRPQLKRQSTSESENGGDQSTKAQTTNGTGQEPNTQKNAGSSGAQNGTGQSASASPPVQAHEAQDQSSQTQSSQNYYRPTLRRGKPTESAPEDTPDELTRTTETAGPFSAGGASTGTATKPAVQLVPAISDAGGPQPESYKFFWKEGEEDDRRKQMVALAGKEVQTYLTTLAKETIPAKPVVTNGRTSNSEKNAHKAAKVEPIFENIQFTAVDVWRNNQPVMILTAEAHLPQTAGSSTAATVYYVTLAARTDIYGDLRKLYSGVTDNFHLDVTPRLQLIDAVDADGDGRGELLFRETTDAGTGYLIYRPTGDTLWKMFDSLNEE